MSALGPGSQIERYRYRLDDLTREGDTTPARVIFERFLERVEQRVATVAELLKKLFSTKFPQEL